MNEQESADEEVFAQHGEVSGNDEHPEDEKLLENYLSFDDEDFLVRESFNGALFTTPRSVSSHVVLLFLLCVSRTRQG